MEQFESGAGVGAAPPIVPGALGSRPAAWPTVLGVISVVLGSLGIAKNACSGISGLAQGILGTNALGYSPPKGYVGAGVVSLISLGVSVWLLVAGIKLLKRKADAVRLHRGWAWTRIAVVLLETAIAVVVQVVTVSAMMQSAGSGGGAPAGMGPVVMGIGILTLVVTLLFGLAYPIVVLQVLSRPWAQQEVARWSGFCAKCGYSLSGLGPDARCPECGQERSRCLVCGYDLRGLAAGAPCPECSAGRGAQGAAHAEG